MGLTKRRALLLQSREIAKDWLTLADEAPHHGVDEAGLAEATLGLGQAHALVDNGVLGDAVEEEDLI